MDDGHHCEPLMMSLDGASTWLHVNSLPYARLHICGNSCYSWIQMLCGGEMSSNPTITSARIPHVVVGRYFVPVYIHHVFLSFISFPKKTLCFAFFQAPICYHFCQVVLHQVVRPFFTSSPFVWPHTAQRNHPICFDPLHTFFLFAFAFINIAPSHTSPHLHITHMDALELLLAEFFGHGTSTDRKRIIGKRHAPSLTIYFIVSHNEP